MKQFFINGLAKITQALKDPNITREDFAFRIAPRWALEGLRNYFRVQSYGLENLPTSGPAIIISNHSGFAGFDALMLANEVRRETARKPKLLTHKLWFTGDILRYLSTQFGFVKADLSKAKETIDQGNLLIFFPEGEEGNFKATKNKYKLQEFKRGFLRLALSTGAPVIPAIVIGAEESNINFSQLSATKKLLGLPLPIPVNIVPLPVNWTLHFFKPLDLSEYSEADISDSKKLGALARKVRHQMQKRIVREIREHRDLSLRNLDLDEDDIL